MLVDTMTQNEASFATPYPTVVSSINGTDGGKIKKDAFQGQEQKQSSHACDVKKTHLLIKINEASGSQ